MLARVVSVNVGLPGPLVPAGGTQPTGRTSAIAKAPVQGRVSIGPLGAQGDAVADPHNHGGPDKALHAHFLQHLAWWAALRGAPLGPGAIGENLTLAAPLAGEPEPDEGTFCIGDVVEIGTCMLQVTQPRVPCAKQAERVNIPDGVARVVMSGRCGLYLRVLQPGDIGAGDVLRLHERPNPGLTVGHAHRFVHQARDDAALAASLAHAVGVGDELRHRAERTRAQAP